MPTYIIEHLEQRVWKWCLIEYEHVSKIVGKSNLWFTNVKRRNKGLESIGKTMEKSASDLKLQKACILDPEAVKTLTPIDAKKFDYFIFGGILGDYPSKRRTKKALTSKLKHLPARNLGKKQMATDNAVYVVKQIVEGKRLSDLKFVDEVKIQINESEETILPFQYVVVDGKPLMSEKLLKYLKRKRGF